MTWSSELNQLRNRTQAVLDATIELFADVYPQQRDVPEQAVVRKTREHLLDPFLVVIAGEFNAGKSSLINAVLGSTVMDEGVTPTTDAVTVLRYAPEQMALLQQQGYVVRALPVPLLQRLSIVDTPGTNAVMRHHEVLTREIVPRADVVLFVTSADRPFSETERAFLSMLREWQRNVVIVINKIDLLKPAEQATVQTFVREQAQAVFGAEPLILLVSARQAQIADDYAQSGMPALMEYITQRLDDRTRLQIRLTSPLGVTEQALQVLTKGIVQQQQAMAGDVHTVAHLDGQIQQFAADMRRDVAGHRAALGQVISEAEIRGVAFFDEHIRILNIHKLLRGDAVQHAFEHEVAVDLADAIEGRTQELVDWMVERNLQLWQGVGDYVRRHAKTNEHMLGDLPTQFQYNRQALIRDIVDTANRIVATYDRSAEALHVANELRNAVATTAVVQVGAIGIGALIATLLKGAIFDTTGVIAASVIALGGLYIIPNRRAALKRQLRERLSQMRAQLTQVIDAQFERELERMLRQMRDATRPYARLVASEVERLDGAQQAATTLAADVARIRADVTNTLATYPSED